MLDNEGDARLVALVEQHHAELLSYANRLLSNRSDAEDVVNDAWFEALHKVRRGTKAPLNYRAYLFRVVHNKAVSLLRRNGRQAPTADLDELWIARSSDGSEVLDARLDWLRMLEDFARERLRPRELATVILPVFGFTDHEIAEITGIRRNSVSSVRSRTLAKIRGRNGRQDRWPVTGRSGARRG